MVLSCKVMVGLRVKKVQGAGTAQDSRGHVVPPLKSWQGKRYAVRWAPSVAPPPLAAPLSFSNDVWSTGWARGQGPTCWLGVVGWGDSHAGIGGSGGGRTAYSKGLSAPPTKVAHTHVPAPAH